jgi:TonB family protein
MFRLCLLFSLTTTGVLLAADLSGSWRGVLERDGKRESMSLTLRQQEQEVSGTLVFDGEVKRMPVEKPELNGDLLTFEVHDAGGRLIKFHVTVTGERMAGDADVGDQTSKIQMARTSSTAVYRVGGDVSAPVLVHKVEPQYSEEARRAKLEGTVRLAVVINPNGDATNIRVIRGLGSGLDEKAIDCVKQWKFKPAYKGDQPVNVEATIEVNFRQ